MYQNTNEIFVSVIVPTKNSSSTLEICLNSVKQQTYKNVEIILIDNYSSDNTIDIARRYTNKIYVIGPERSTQVNYGVKMAKGKYIYRVDSDFLLQKTVIEEAVNEAETGNYAAVLIHNTSDPSISFWAQVRKFERDMYVTDETNVAVRFIRKDVYMSIGGYDSTLIAGEDYDLHNRIVTNHMIGRVSAKEIHLGEPKTLMEVAKKHYYYGKTAHAFLVKNKRIGYIQFSPIRVAYLRSYEKFLRHPMLSLGFFVYQIVRYSSSILGILSSRL